VSTWYTLYCRDCKARAGEGTTHNLPYLSGVANQADLLRRATWILGEDSVFEIRMDANWFPDWLGDDDDIGLVQFALVHFSHRLAIMNEYGDILGLDEPWEKIEEA
jgi:hypothetical protein